MVFLSHVHYLTGYKFDVERISRAIRDINSIANPLDGTVVFGLDLAHSIGNDVASLRLSDWRVDFAVFCSYKYLNAGPGGIAGCFIHSDHHHREDSVGMECYYYATRISLPLWN